MDCFLYSQAIINCLLTIFVHKYYVQPIYYTYGSKGCESLTDYSISLNAADSDDWDVTVANVTTIVDGN